MALKSPFNLMIIEYVRFLANRENLNMVNQRMTPLKVFPVSDSSTSCLISKSINIKYICIIIFHIISYLQQKYKITK